MKRIELRNNAEQNSITLFKAILGNAPPNRPLTLDDTRKRVRVLDAIDKLSPDATELILEDADQAVLKQAVEDAPYNIANTKVLELVDMVINAKVYKVPTPAEVTKD